MSVEWAEYRVEDIAIDGPNAMSTGPFGSSISAKFFQEVGVPVIRGSNLSTEISELMSDYGLVFVGKEKAKEFSRSVVRAGDLIFTCWGTINQVGLITDDLKYSEYIISNKQMKLTPDPEKADALFLYYLFSSPFKQSEILNNGIGAAVPGFNLGQLKKHIIRLPHIAKQRRIAGVLGGFDKKIRINRQLNKSLEEIAQALFKAWFVDFEPVKAKIEAKIIGQDPERAAMCAISGKSDDELDRLTAEQFAHLRDTAALFPDELFESKLGMIPDGWKWSTIGEEVEVVGGGTPSTKNPDFWESGSFHWTTPKDLSRIEDKVLLDTERKITEAGLKKISSGLLPVDTVLLSSRAPVGYLALAKIPVAVNQGYIAMKCEKSLPPVYVLQWANSVMDEIKQRASGTTFAEINKKNFRIIPVLIPADKILNTYSQRLNCLYEKIAEINREIRTLTQLRDTLLPKLLSGEISLSKEVA